MVDTPLAHRESLNDRQREVLDTNATEFYKALARAAQAGVTEAFDIEVGNQIRAFVPEQES